MNEKNYEAFSSEVQKHLRAIVQSEYGKLNHMWATFVDRDGVVKLCVFSGDNRHD